MAYEWGSPLPDVTLSIQCPTAGCTGSATPELTVNALWFRLRDDFRPSINRVTGFLAGGTTRGVAEASFEATDRGGGVYMQELVIDDVGQGKTIVDDNGGSCRTPFVARVPCKLAALGTVAFDTTKVRDGDHTVALRVYDATLDNVTTYGPVPVRVDNAPAPATETQSSGSSAPAPAPSSAPAPAPAPAGAPQQEPTQSAAASSPPPATTATPAAAAPPVEGSSTAPPAIRVVPRRSARVVRQAFGRSSILQGHLLDSAGNPVAGTEVGAYVTLDVPGANPSLAATTVTGPDGAYRLTLPGGSSRRVTIRPTTREATPWTFRARVRAPISLVPSRKHLRNGDKLTLTAFLKGKPPARSADVSFQVLIGTQWRTFATRTITAGMAKVTHRFHVTYHRMTYRFRAITLRRRNFPFDNARSRTVAVQVN